jgi:hypothetical protein
VRGPRSPNQASALRAGHRREWFLQRGKGSASGQYIYGKARIGVIIAVVGLVAFGGFAKGKWY